MLRRTSADRRVFRGGWGDPAVLEWYDGIVRVPPEVPAVDPDTAGPVLDGTFEVTDLTFDSPAEHLPEASRPARARMIAPADGTERVCVLMAAWNDHGYATRTKLAELLAARGVAAVMLENPLYGDRRADRSDGLPLATVSDFALMGRAAVVEGMTLLRHYHDTGMQTAVSGYSMGGNIAAFVGALTDFPVAIAPAAAPYSPAPPFIEGVLRHGIAWAALGGDEPATRERLERFFRSASVLDHDPAPHTAAAVLVAGTIDGFVPAAAVLSLSHHWPGAQVDWIRAGHATLLWRFKDRMADAVVSSFERLDALAG